MRSVSPFFRCVALGAILTTLGSVAQAAETSNSVYERSMRRGELLRAHAQGRLDELRWSVSKPKAPPTSLQGVLVSAAAVVAEERAEASASLLAWAKSGIESSTGLRERAGVRLGQLLTDERWTTRWNAYDALVALEMVEPAGDIAALSQVLFPRALPAAGPSKTQDKSLIEGFLRVMRHREPAVRTTLAVVLESLDAGLPVGPLLAM